MSLIWYLRLSICLILQLRLIHAQQQQSKEPTCSVSSKTGNPFQLLIQNMSPWNLTLYWLNPDCEPIYYGMIRPASSMNQTTWLNFSWVLVENSSTAIVERLQSISPNSTNVWRITPETIATASDGTPLDSSSNNGSQKIILASKIPSCSPEKRARISLNMTVRNLSPTVLTLYWVDSMCNRNFFANLPGSSYIPQPTAINDSWIVVDNKTLQVVDRFKPLVRSADRWDIPNTQQFSLDSASETHPSGPVPSHEKSGEGSNILNSGVESDTQEKKNATTMNASLNASGQPMSKSAITIGSLIAASFVVAAAVFFFTRTEQKKNASLKKPTGNKKHLSSSSVWSLYDTGDESIKAAPQTTSPSS